MMKKTQSFGQVKCGATAHQFIFSKISEGTTLCYLNYCLDEISHTEMSPGPQLVVVMRE